MRWNDEARSKILIHADNVLRDAVAAVAREFTGTSREDAFRALNERLEDR